MSDAGAGFTFDMKGIDREALLHDAAQRLDDLQNYLGPERGTGEETPLASQIRLFSQDEANFADIPVMYKITDEYFASIKQKVPYSFTQLEERFNFYWLDIPLKLHSVGNWDFSQIKVYIEFNPQSPKDGSRPKAYSILPNQEFVEYLKLHGQAEVQLDGNLKFSAQVPTVSVPLGTLPVPIGADLAAGAGAKVGADIGAAIPRHEYTLKVSKLLHAAIGAEDVWWDLRGREFSRENRPQLSIIVQVLKEVQEFKVGGQMETARSFRFAPANLQEAIQGLPKALREFFQKGLPIYDSKPRDKQDGPWDMTRFL